MSERKKDSRGTAAVASKQNAQDCILTEVSGELSIENGRLIGNITIPVASAGFRCSDSIMILEQECGIAVRYVGENNMFDCGDPTVCIHHIIDIPAPASWKKDTEVRVMCLNEGEDKDFQGLRDYFIFKIRVFGFEQVPYERYLQRTIQWNANIANSNNQVNTECPEDPPFLGPRLSKKTDGILTLK